MYVHHTNTSLSDARDARMRAAHDALTQAVADLASSDGWATMLQVAARMRQYSTNNILLIAAQRPDATLVAGYQAWRDRGCAVMKGQKGIAILAPCLYRPDDDAEHVTTDGPSLVKQVRGFRVVHVFDVTQTSGAAAIDPTPRPLCGGAPANLWDALEAQVIAAGFTLERGACGGAYGLTKFDSRTVRVRDDLQPAQAVKTLAHELGHILADHEHRYLQQAAREPACRDAAEVEAESIAYLVTAAAGIDTAPYSVPYIAAWAGTSSTLPYTTAQVVLSVATTINAQHERYVLPRPHDVSHLQATTEHVSAATWSQDLDSHLRPHTQPDADTPQR